MARADKVAAGTTREKSSMSALDPATSNIIRLPLTDAAVARHGAPAEGREAAYIPARLGTLAEIDYLRNYDSGIYRDLDLELTLDYMRRRFVAPLARHLDLTAATLLDCASGFGWLAFAYLLAGGKHAVLVEMDAPRLDAARAIAARLGVERRCTFVTARIQDIDLGEDGVDIFASIETLEHVGRDNIGPAVRTMARTARRAVVLTTPNFLFPVVAHDTELPLAHWLPAGLRRRYAAAKGRAAMDRGNQFVMPWDLAPLAAKFRPVSRYQTFATGRSMNGSIRITCLMARTRNSATAPARSAGSARCTARWRARSGAIPSPWRRTWRRCGCGATDAASGGGSRLQFAQRLFDHVLGVVLFGDAIVFLEHRGAVAVGELDRAEIDERLLHPRPPQADIAHRRHDAAEQARAKLGGGERVDVQVEAFLDVEPGRLPGIGRLEAGRASGSRPRPGIPRAGRAPSR